MSLSERALSINAGTSREQADDYDKDDNPNGLINLSISENALGLHRIVEKLGDIDGWKECLKSVSTMHTYYEEHGIPRLRKAMARFFEEFFEGSAPVNPDNLYFLTATRGCLEMLLRLIADPGDVFMTTTPVYMGIRKAIEDGSQIGIWPIPLTHLDGFALDMEKVENSYVAAQKAGKKVRGILLVNPGNPIGEIIEIELIEAILAFCASKKIHYIGDEVYALSIHNPTSTFKSVLSIKSLPDPNRTHLVYGLSKDLALTKLRVGCLHTYNKEIQDRVEILAAPQCIPHPIMHVASVVLEDLDWCRSLLAEVRPLLRENYVVVIKKLWGLQLRFHHSPAAFYVWVNLEEFCKPLTVEGELELDNLIKKRSKVSICRGAAFLSPEVGWFRIVFTKPREEVVEAMNRLESLVTELRRASKGMVNSESGHTHFQGF